MASFAAKNHSRVIASTPMPENFLLIDYENIQPANLDSFKDRDWLIKVFLGSSQGSLAVGKVRALQIFGESVEYIQSDGGGPNAVDFHIAFYLGRLALENPGGRFRVLSKDKGFDPLLRHLRKQGIDCQRDTLSVAASSASGMSPAAKTVASLLVFDERIAKIQELLRTQAGHRPKTMRRLRSAINTHLGGKLNDASIDRVVNGLRKLGVVTEAGGKLGYADGSVEDSDDMGGVD